jgi:hypothetical protein
MAGPELATIRGGVERVGRDYYGYAVLRRVKPGSGPVPVVIETARSPAIVVGRWLTVVGLVGVITLLAAQVGKLLRARLSARAPSSSSARTTPP